MSVVVNINIRLRENQNCVVRLQAVGVYHLMRLSHLG